MQQLTVARHTVRQLEAWGVEYVFGLAGDTINQAERPLLLVGQGARGQTAAVLALAEQLQAAIVHTMPALGIIPSTHPRNLGIIGEFGSQSAAETFGQADVIVVLGSTWWQPRYVPAARFIQIDRAANHLGLTFPVDVGIAASIEDAAHELRRRLQPAARPAWSRLIEQLKTQWTKHLEGDHTGEQPARPVMAGPPAPGPLTPPWTPGDGWQPRVDRPESAPGLRPAAIIRALERRLGGDAVLCLDVGDNTFWVASLFRAHGQRVLISGHWRSMGFALPAAIAAKLAAPRVPVVAVCGDGDFAMTMAEFTTAVALDLPIVVIVLNNRALAEESHKQLRMQLQPFGVRLHNPDFAVFARACGGEGHRVDDEASLDRALAAALRARRPCLLDVHTQIRMPALAEPRGTLAPPATPLATARGPF